MPTAPVTPFDAEIPQADLDDLQERLARVRWPDELRDAGWDYGVPLGYMRELVDVLARPVRLAGPGSAAQRVPAVRHELDGQRVHFLHISARPSPTPCR